MDKERLDEIEKNLSNIEFAFKELSDGVEITCTFLREIYKDIKSLKDEYKTK